MNNVGEKFLPVGTVVMLNGGKKRLMITGFCSMAKDNPSVMYDYSGCLYPEGVLSSDETALFNHNQIVQVFHVGFVDEEEKKFKENLKNILANMNKQQQVQAQAQPQPQTQVQPPQA